MKWAVFFLLIVVALDGASMAQSIPVISVCDLIRNPDNWESKIIAVRGAVAIASNNLPVPIGGIFLVPTSTERCTYRGSKYANSDEPAEIMLAYPDVHFLSRPPAGFSLRKSSVDYASTRLRQIQRTDPSARQAIVTVEGFVSLRKYNLRELEKNVEAKKTPRPQHTLPPVILTIQAYRSVE